MSQQHTITTRHIQSLIKNALLLAEAVDGEKATGVYDLGGPFPMERPISEVGIVVPKDVHAAGVVLPEWALCKAISDLRHAADELDAERLSCYGWEQR